MIGLLRNNVSVKNLDCGLRRIITDHNVDPVPAIILFVRYHTTNCKAADAIVELLYDLLAACTAEVPDWATKNKKSWCANFVILMITLLAVASSRDENTAEKRCFQPTLVQCGFGTKHWR